MLGKWFKRKEEENITQSPDIATSEITAKPEAQETKVVMLDDSQNTTTTVAEIEAAAHFESETVPSEPQEQIPTITYKEARALKKSRYEEIMNNPKCTKSYVLMNKKTGQIVEIKAFSSFHACNIIGWKHNKVKVIMEKDTVQNQPETTTLSK